MSHQVHNYGHQVSPLLIAERSINQDGQFVPLDVPVKPSHLYLALASSFSLTIPATTGFCYLELRLLILPQPPTSDPNGVHNMYAVKRTHEPDDTLHARDAIDYDSYEGNIGVLPSSSKILISIPQDLSPQGVTSSHISVGQSVGPGEDLEMGAASRYRRFTDYPPYEVQQIRFVVVGQGGSNPIVSGTVQVYEYPKFEDVQ